MINQILFILLGLFVSFISQNVDTASVTPQDYITYKRYLQLYPRTYTTPDFWSHLSIFTTNNDYITKHNTNLTTHYRLGWNNLTDMDPQDFRKTYLGFKMDTSPRPCTGYCHNTTNPIPNSIDWRAAGIVTNVKNQGQCGSCWAFSAIGAIEGQHARQTGNLVSLSEQNLVDCVSASKYNCYGCEGGWPDKAMEYVTNNHGIDTEKSYPYLAVDEGCEYKKNSSGGNISRVVSIDYGNMKALYNALGTIGPISVAIDAENDFQFYKSGIFRSTTCSKTQLDHAVLAIGYGVTLKNETFIMIKNSWGEDWGMNGYIYFSGDIDNMCGIATNASYPIA